jgi:aminoglycoside/choline kinase family phosphotransferase
MLNFQEIRKECKKINYNLSYQDINRLIELYYKCKKDFLSAYFTTKQQIIFKNSKKRYDLIQFDKSTLDTNLTLFGELKYILRNLEKILNIKPDKTIDQYILEVKIKKSIGD